jgi:hypothetical protein
VQQRHVSEGPAAWAETLLRVLSPPHEREAEVAELRDAYRDQVYALRGGRGATAWSLAQVAGVIWRASHTLSLVLVFAWVASWFVPGIPALVLGADASTRGPAALVLAAALTLPSFVMFGGGAWAGWRTHGPWASVVIGFFVSLGFALALLVAYVAGIALGQPQLLRFAFTPESLQAMAAQVLTTTGTGTAMSTLGGFAGAAARRTTLRTRMPR